MGNFQRYLALTMQFQGYKQRVKVHQEAQELRRSFLHFLFFSYLTDPPLMLLQPLLVLPQQLGLVSLCQKHSFNASSETITILCLHLLTLPLLKSANEVLGILSPLPNLVAFFHKGNRNLAKKNCKFLLLGRMEEGRGLRNVGIS